MITTVPDARTHGIEFGLLTGIQLSVWEESQRGLSLASSFAFLRDCDGPAERRSYGLVVTIYSVKIETQPVERSRLTKMTVRLKNVLHL